MKTEELVSVGPEFDDANDSELRRIEKRTGLALPAESAAFLRQYGIAGFAGDAHVVGDDGHLHPVSVLLGAGDESNGVLEILRTGAQELRD